MLSASSAFSQGYITSLGVRVGDNDNFRMAGLLFQQRIFKKMTLEGIVQTDFSKNTTLHLLGEYHQNIVSKYFNFYLGAGLSGGWEEYNKLDNAAQVTTMGADLIAGLELTMLHWNISLDYKPNFNITGRESWYQGQVGISVRAVLLNDSDFKKHKREKAREKRKKEKEKDKKKKLKEGDPKPRLDDILDDLFKKKK
jgi:hypothetical protein